MSEILEENLNKLAYGTFLLLIGFFFGKMFSYIFRLVIARNGASEYGIFSLGVTILGVITIGCLIGLDRGITKFVSHYNAKNDKIMIKSYINTSLKITAIWSIIIGIFLFFLSDIISINIFNKPELSIVLKIFSVLLPFYILGQMFISIMTAYQKIKYVTFISIFQYGLTLLLLIVLMFYNVSNISGALAYALAFIISGIISLFIVKLRIFNFFDKSIKTVDVSKSLRNFSLPLMFNNFVEYLIISLDMLLIGYLLTSPDIGVYSAAYVTTQLISLLPAVLMWVFAPALSDLFAKNLHKEAKEIFIQSSRWIFIIAIPVVSFSIFFSRSIMNSLFGHEYLSGSLAFMILSISIFILSLSSIERKSLEISNHPKKLLYYSLFAFIINLALNLYLIPLYGILGSAIANIITFTIYSGLCIYKSKKELNFVQDYSKYILPTIMAFVSALIFYYLAYISKIRLGFTVLGIMSLMHFFAYLILLRLTNSIDKNDVHLVKSLYKNIKNIGKNKLNLKRNS